MCLIYLLVLLEAGATKAIFFLFSGIHHALSCDVIQQIGSAQGKDSQQRNLLEYDGLFNLLISGREPVIARVCSVNHMREKEREGERDLCGKIWAYLHIVSVQLAHSFCDSHPFLSNHKNALKVQINFTNAVEKNKMQL
uniref:Secreted protein n=1 Tax=Aegilops tauschii subsp. strangulata TaxID=200361 RepID=A0A452XLK5_AEGTS